MNGDVGKELCGEHCPTSESPCQKVPSEKSMNNPAKHVSESNESEDKMTEAIASPANMQNDANCSEYSVKTEAVNGVLKEASDNEESHLQEDGKSDDTGQEREQSDALQLAPAQNDKASNEPLTREQIKELIGQNVEYFFSRENWSSDPYLLSQMDSDQYVPVYILANCSQFKTITKDHSIIMEALKDSVFVQLDEEKNRVRPNYKRCIVILREIPKTTPIKEIEAMFEGEGCPKSVSCEFVHNDFWYVTFESDNDAQKAYRYLRETVKTFKDKPILARIKTKPMSRLGCLSVLPSYSGKAPGESREGVIPNQGAAANSTGGVPTGASTGPGISGIPNSPHPPNAYPASNPQRMYYSPQNNVNQSYPNYNFTNSAQIPTAYFYPNPMMQWSSPSFYDINSFIQYNGLTPRAAFKPPTSTRFNSNGNNTRRNKNRDSKFDKNESRQLSGGTNGGSQVRHNQSNNSRPQSAQSPHPCSQAGPQNTITHHSLTTNQSTAQPSNLSKGESQTNISTSSSPALNHNSNLVHTSHNSFAQNDLSLASQSNLYTSFSPPAGCNIPRDSAVKVEKSDKVDLSNLSPSLDSTQTSVMEIEQIPSSEAAASTIIASPNTAISNSSPIITASQNSHSNATTSTSVSSIHQPSQNSVTTQPLPHHHHHHYHNQSMPVSHRNSFSNESHSIRDPQPQRQMSRGGRRRISRRDDEMNGHSGSGGGRGSQRGMAPQGTNGDAHGKNNPHPEMKKPSFELQSTSFPPLPTADEIAASISEEKIPEPPSQLAWSGDTHKFSDVMKGTVKPKHTPPASNTEKEPVADPLSPIISCSDSSSKPIEKNAIGTNQQTSVLENSIQSSNSSSLSNNNNNTTTTNNNNNTNAVNSVSTITTPTTPTTISTTTTATATTTTNSNSTNTNCTKGVSEGTQPGSATVVRQERAVPGRDQRPVRDDRRNPGMQVIRRERDFVPGIGRGGPRREREGGNFRLSGNKENRPQAGSSRCWREERADPDGWITKGPRETRAHRDNRYQHQHPNHPHNFYENRNSNSKPQAVVNGDVSPPPSPKSEVVQKQVDTNANKVAPNVIKNFSKPESKPQKNEVIPEKEKLLNNNDGEHKPSWAKMALASKDHMERLSAELKEKEEQERLKKIRTKVVQKVPERVSVGREREGKPFRRENFSPREREREFVEKGRDFRGPERNNTFGYKAPREALRPKSPK